jgi:hypothetical protein
MGTGVAGDMRVRVVCGEGCRRYMIVKVAGGRSGTWEVSVGRCRSST